MAWRGVAVYLDLGKGFFFVVLKIRFDGLTLSNSLRNDKVFFAGRGKASSATTCGIGPASKTIVPAEVLSNTPNVSGPLRILH